MDEVRERSTPIIHDHAALTPSTMSSSLRCVIRVETRLPIGQFSSWAMMSMDGIATSILLDLPCRA